MGVSIYDLMNAVLVQLGDPRANCPNDAELLDQVCMQTRTVLRAKRNSGNPWNFADTIVETQPQETLYQITVPDFGTPLSVVTINDMQLPAFVPRRIPFYLAADIDGMEWGMPENAGAWYGAWYLSASDPNHVALRANFTWRQNVPYIELLPFGNQQASYKIKYLQSASGVQDMALATAPVPAEDADLIVLRSAKGLLPNTQWEGNNEPANAAKRRELYVSLKENEQLAWEQFNAANLLVEGPNVHVRWQGSIVG